TGFRKWTNRRPVTVGKRYQVASRPQASSRAAATRPPWTSPGPAWCWAVNSSRTRTRSGPRAPASRDGFLPRCRRSPSRPDRDGAGSPRRRSAKPAALVVGLEELARARGRHGRRGGDLQRERRGGDDLREPVDLAGAGAAHQREPRTGVGEGG